MKIVYITNESYLDNSFTIAKELGKKVNLTVYVQAKEGTEEISRWCSELGAAFVKRKRYRNPLSLFTELKFILNIRKQNADKVWFNTITFYQLLLVRLFLKKFIVMVHDVEFHPELKDPFAAFSVRLSFLMLKKRLCTASQTQAEIYENRHGYRPKVFQLPVIDYFSHIAEKKVIERDTDGPTKFFFFGSIKRYKGIETLIEAAEILQEEGAKCEISLYGKFRYQAGELAARINRLSNVSLRDEFIRFDQIHAIYSQNDVLVLPYRHVTQCGPLLIGFNQFVPAICSDLPGFREYVIHGKSGLLFNNSSNDLAEKMLMIINNPKLQDEMKEFIRTETFEKFSMQNLVDGYIRNLSDVQGSEKIF